MGKYFMTFVTNNLSFINFIKFYLVSRWYISKDYTLGVLQNPTTFTCYKRYHILTTNIKWSTITFMKKVKMTGSTFLGS